MTGLTGDVPERWPSRLSLDGVRLMNPSHPQARHQRLVRGTTDPRAIADCIRTVVASHNGQLSPRGRMSKKITVAAMTRRTSSPPKTSVKIVASDMARVLPRAGVLRSELFAEEGDRAHPRLLCRIHICAILSCLVPQEAMPRTSIYHRFIRLA